jgi:imidazolonepropionase-like amidohydrolase
MAGLLLCAAIAGIRAMGATTGARRLPGQAHGRSPLPVDTPIALVGGTIVDGVGGPPRPGMTLVVRGRHIHDLFPSGTRPLPAGAVVVDLAGQHVIPGLIDAHVHLGTQPRPPGVMTQVLQHVLMSGVTTVRDMGGSMAIVRPLALAAASDTVRSSRVYYAAVMTGPGRWFEGPFGANAAEPAAMGDSPLVRRVGPGTDVVRIIAEAKGAGASGIKLYNTVDPALLRALAAEAHRQGLRVWSHLAVDPGRPSDVVDAGVDVVSHGDQFRGELTTDLPAGLSDSLRRAMRLEQYARMSPDDPRLTALLERMRRAGTTLDPTLFIMVPRELPPEMPAVERDRALAAFRFAAAMTRRAVRMGIPVVAGTDAIGGSSANLHAELQLLVDSAGLTPMQAIRAATHDAARAIGAQDSLGTIATGMLADLVVLCADPVADVRNTQRVWGVMRAGRLYRRTAPIRPAPLARAPASGPGC